LKWGKGDGGNKWGQININFLCRQISLNHKKINVDLTPIIVSPIAFAPLRLEINVDLTPFIFSASECKLKNCMLNAN
jgi:hypothetical protein